MKRYEAIFLDRDGTLSRNCPEKAGERDLAIGRIIGIADFHISDDMKMEVFWRVMKDPNGKPVNCLAHEDEFWRKWLRLILEDHGVHEESETLAAELHERFCFYRIMAPYPETIRVLEALKAQRYPMGVISDTFPSLQESLKSMGIAHYFKSFTCSALVGAGKPDPRIFNVALQSLGAKAEDSVFVDDCKEEADGARDQGFTSFHLDRSLAQPDFDNWTIGNLEHLLDFLAASGEFA